MNGITRGLIEYTGIAERMYSDSDTFKQLVLAKHFCLPVERPDIDQITKAGVTCEITDTAIINTPKGVSLEGFRLTGNSLVISGNIKIKMQYASKLREQPIHTAYFSMPFSTVIALDENFVETSYITISRSIEDIDVKLLDDRCVYVRTAIYIAVESC